MTFHDLQEIEVTYAPPYSSSKDPVNILGYVAENMLKDDIRLINYDNFTTIF